LNIDSDNNRPKKTLSFHHIHIKTYDLAEFDFLQKNAACTQQAAFF